MPRINRFPMRAKRGLWERELSGVNVVGMAMIGDVAYALGYSSGSWAVWSNSGGSWALIVTSPVSYSRYNRPNIRVWGGEIFLSSSGLTNSTIYRLSESSLILEWSVNVALNALIQNGAYLFGTGSWTGAGDKGHRRDGPANWTADICDEYLENRVYWEGIFDGAIHGPVYRYTGVGNTLTRVAQTGLTYNSSYQMGEFDGKLWFGSGTTNYLRYKTSGVADWVQGPSKLLPSEYTARGCHGADGKLWVFFYPVREIWTWDGTIWERELILKYGEEVQWMTSNADFLYVATERGIYKRTFE